MTIDINQMKILYGFKSKTWPLSKCIMTALNNFAYNNLLATTAVNATIWTSIDQNKNADHLDNIIQVTYYDNVPNQSIVHLKYVYPLVAKPVDAFEDDLFYANSIEEYFAMCSRCSSVFSEFSTEFKSGKILKYVTNAENALIELEMTSAVE